jgi:hypothetical protein
MKCATCYGSYHECPGHFGYIELVKPVYHIGFLKKVVQVLRCVCYSCSKVCRATDSPCASPPCSCSCLHTTPSSFRSLRRQNHRRASAFRPLPSSVHAGAVAATIKRTSQSWPIQFARLASLRCHHINRRAKHVFRRDTVDAESHSPHIVFHRRRLARLAHFAPQLIRLRAIAWTSALNGRWLIQTKRQRSDM